MSGDDVEGMDYTQLALNMIQSSANRCYRATGIKCGVVCVSKEMAEDMEEGVLEAFDDMIVVDDRLPGFTCYAVAAHGDKKP